MKIPKPRLPRSNLLDKMMKRTRIRKPKELTILQAKPTTSHLGRLGTALGETAGFKRARLGMSIAAKARSPLGLATLGATTLATTYGIHRYRKNKSKVQRVRRVNQ